MQKLQNHNYGEWLLQFFQVLMTIYVYDFLIFRAIVNPTSTITIGFVIERMVLFQYHYFGGYCILYVLNYNFSNQFKKLLNYAKPVKLGIRPLHRTFILMICFVLK